MYNFWGVGGGEWKNFIELQCFTLQIQKNTAFAKMLGNIATHYSSTKKSPVPNLFVPNLFVGWWGVRILNVQFRGGGKNFSELQCFTLQIQKTLPLQSCFAFAKLL
jgi:hypothetical protein